MKPVAATRRIDNANERFFKAITAGVLLTKRAELIAHTGPLTPKRIEASSEIAGDALTGELLRMHKTWSSTTHGDDMPLVAVHDQFQAALEPLRRALAGEADVVVPAETERLLDLTNAINKSPGVYARTLAKPTVSRSWGNY